MLYIEALKYMIKGNGPRVADYHNDINFSERSHHSSQNLTNDNTLGRNCLR